MRTVSLLLLAVLTAVPARALGATPSQRLRGEVEERARGELADLFRSLCPEQCVLLGVQARVEEEPVGQGDPGFETLAGARAPVLRAVNASVVVDGRLPAAFRTRVKTLVTERLAALGAPATVSVDRVNFPVRNPPHLEAQERGPVPPAAPPEVDPAVPEKAAAERAVERLADAAPLLAVIGILALVLLVLGVLLYLAFRRASDASAAAWAPLEAAEADGGSGLGGEAPAARAPEFQAERARRLVKTLGEERAIRNVVLRDALARREAPLVARWVRELGDFLVEDLRGDPDLADGIEALSAELVRPAARDAAGRHDALAALEGRVTAARLRRAPETAADAFVFLDGVRPDAFAAAADGLPSAAASIALRYAPPRLRAAALESLPVDRRETLALAWATRSDVDTTEALAAADALRERLATTSGGATQANRVLTELLDTLTRQEQDALLERLAADPAARGGALAGESALLAAPAPLVAAAALSISPEQLAAYTAGAEPELRARVLGACPTRIRLELEEELGLGRTATRAEFLAARTAIVAALRREAAVRGTPLATHPQRPRLVEPRE
jgi:hypothetical protein